MKELLLTINRYSFKFQKIHIYLKKKIQSCRCILHLYQIHSNILIPNWKAGNERGVCAFFLFLKTLLVVNSFPFSYAIDVSYLFL